MSMEKRSYFKDIFIARDNELKNLKYFLDQAIRGKGHLLLIKADPGMGKTRLVEELYDYIGIKGATILKGKCIENCSVPYRPFGKALIELAENFKQDPKGVEKIKLAAGDNCYELSQFVPNLEDILGSRIPQGKKFKKNKFFNIVTKFLTSLATSKNPLILFFDDLQWADRDTIELLHYLTSQIKYSNIFVIGTYRPQEINNNHPLRILTGKKTKDFPLIEMSLAPLLSINVREMIDGILPIKKEKTDLFSFQIFNKTGGNPFLIKEVIRYLLEQKIIYLDLEEDEWDFNEEELYNLPYTFSPSELIIERVFQLEEDHRLVLNFAAAIGTKFSYELLIKLIPEKAVTIKNVCQKAIAIGVIFEVEDNKYCFTHDLIRETLYQRLGHQEKEHIHLEIGKVLQNQRPLNVFALAYHFSQTSFREKSLKYLLLAAEEAERSYSYQQAWKYYKAARDILISLPDSKDDQEKIIDVSIGLTRSAWFSREASCLPILQEAERLAIKIEDSKRLALIYHWMGRIYYTMGNPKETIKYYQQSYQIAEGAESQEIKALSYNVMGRTKFIQGEYKEAIKILRQGIELIRDI